jgi:hypothetical protein
MKNQSIIPPITDPMGKHWNQPKNVKIMFSSAWIDRSSFEQLMTYQTSLPSGVYEGKMWKRIEGEDWMLCWYEDSKTKKGYCDIKKLKIRIE